MVLTWGGGLPTHQASIGGFHPLLACGGSKVGHAWKNRDLVRELGGMLNGGGVGLQTPTGKEGESSANIKSWWGIERA